jgi:hypothetical protein
MRRSIACASVAAQLSRSVGAVASGAWRPSREEYSRRSAWRVSSSSVAPSSGKVAMPIDDGAR